MFKLQDLGLARLVGWGWGLGVRGLWGLGAWGLGFGFKGGVWGV